MSAPFPPRACWRLGCSGPAGDASDKTLIIRGCDPVMAERAKSFLPGLLGNVQIESYTDDGGSAVCACDCRSSLRAWWCVCAPSFARSLSSTRASCLPACIHSRTTSASIRAHRAAFLQALQARKYTVVAFAPGACRWSAQRQPIPGGNDASMSLPNARTHARARARAYTSLSPKMLVCPLLHFLLCVCVCVCVCVRTPI